MATMSARQSGYHNFVARTLNNASKGAVKVKCTNSEVKEMLLRAASTQNLLTLVQTDGTILLAKRKAVTA